MIQTKFNVKAKLWRYEGASAWHFLSVPKKQSANITKVFGVLKIGWGSLPVLVTIGNSTWKTSIFPDSKTKTYLLPVKSEFRKKEKLEVGKNILFTIEVRT